jgi:hypothetical protein
MKQPKAAPYTRPPEPAPTLRIETQTYGQPTQKTVIPSDRVRFVSVSDDRVMFDVVANPDGSLEVRGVDTCKINGVLRSCRLQIEPHVTNSITIKAMRYDE